MRFASALSVGLTALLAALVARAGSGDKRTGWCAAATYLSCFMIFGIGVTAVLDSMLTFWSTAALAAFWYAYSGTTPARRWMGWTAFGVACGLAFLTKGFVALAMQVVAIAPFMLLQKRWLELIRFGLTVIHGTFWPEPVIGERAPEPTRRAQREGHEFGFHSWDHHGWRCNDRALLAQRSFPFVYQSDCRGESIFLPLVDGEVLPRPQIPVTLPTYDEVIGCEGTTDENYNQRLLDQLDPGRLNALTIHAEVEGITRSELFVDFLDRAQAEGWEFIPLIELLSTSGELPVAPLLAGSIPGREGAVACQGPTQSRASWSAGTPQESCAPVSS